MNLHCVELTEVLRERRHKYLKVWKKLTAHTVPLVGQQLKVLTERTVPLVGQQLKVLTERSVPLVVQQLKVL